MSVRRNVAVINEQLDLRAWFRNDSSGTVFDPVEITKVEMIDTDGVTVLETIDTGNVNFLEIGHYQIVTSAAWNTSSRLVYDRWFFRRIAGGIIYTTLLNVNILATTTPSEKYSTITQLRENVLRIEAGSFDDNAVIRRIAQADAMLEVDLSNMVDFTDMPIVPNTPDYINKLSQYKTAELCLVALFSAKRMVLEPSDWEYWKKLYDDLLNKILSGDIKIASLGTSEFGTSNFPKNTIEPALGQNKRGEFADNDTIEEIRGEFGVQAD